jgi:protoporphyrinogen oxidase
MAKDISIIGGGILGMGLSLELSKRGYRVSLYEAADSLGGLASPWQIENITWDKFYHVILMSDAFTLKILGEIGLNDKMNWVKTKTGFYTDGKLYSMSNSFEFLRFPPLGLIDKFRLGLTIMAASKIKDWKRLEKIYVASWLTKWSGKNTFEKMWLPLLRAKLGDYYKQTSASFIWATIQRMYAAKKGGLKEEMFGYADGGYASILDAFEQKLKAVGVEIFTGHAIKEIISQEGSLTLEFMNGIKYKAKECIVTLPSPTAATLCPTLSVTEKEQLNNIQYLGVICVSMLLKKSISPYYVTNITDTWVPFTGVIEMSALVDKKNFNNNALIYLPKYIAPDDPLFSKSDEDIEKEFKSALMKMYPFISEEDIICMKTARAKRVFALPGLNYSESLPSVKTTVPGLYIANSSYITNGTLNVNETIQLAEKIIQTQFS